MPTSQRHTCQRRRSGGRPPSTALCPAGLTLSGTSYFYNMRNRSCFLERHGPAVRQFLVCLYKSLVHGQLHGLTDWPRSYRKLKLQITQPSQYRNAKLQYRCAVISGSTSKLWRRLFGFYGFFVNQIFKKEIPFSLPQHFVFFISIVIMIIKFFRHKEIALCQI